MERFVWAVLDTDTDTWKEEPKEARWFSLFERMGVCPAIKPKEEKKKSVGVSVKSAKKYPFEDSNVKLTITCTHHGGGISGQDIKKKTQKQISRRSSTASPQSVKE